MLYKTLRPLATGLIKKQISKAVGDGIRKGLEALNDQLGMSDVTCASHMFLDLTCIRSVQVRDKMKNEEHDPEFSRTSVLKDHFSRKSKASSVSSPAPEKGKRSSGTFKIVPKRESMILPGIGYEKGWIKRQSEHEEKAKMGEGWKSAA